MTGITETITFCKGARVALTLATEHHVPFLLSLINDRDTLPFLMRRFPINEQQETEWVKKLYTGNPPTDLMFILVSLDTPEHVPIGTMGLHRINWVHGTATTGSMLTPGARGKGYGTEAKVLLLDYAFNLLNLRIVLSDVWSFNEASLRAQQKCGYVEVARIPNMVRLGDTYHDQVLFQATRESFEAARTLLGL
jgi:RimJ/RimL family protein N-acetyltransferase